MRSTTTASPGGSTRPDGLVTPRFAVITASALAYFVSLGMLLPTLPRYVENDLSGTKLQVGIVAGVFGIAAGLVRPWLGRLGDVYGRRVLLVGGAALSGAAVFFYPLWASIPFLIGLRIVSGVGEAGAFIGAAVSTQDLAPDDRRGEAASYFSLAIYVGLGVGPILGEYLDKQYGFDRVAQLAALMLGTSAVLGFAVPRNTDYAPPGSRRKGFLHPASVAPGLLLTLSLVGFVGYTTFLSLYLDRLGGGPDTGSSGPVFVLYSAIVIVFRLFLADLPDRLGPRRSGAAAFAFITIGLGVVALWGTLPGVYVGTAILAFGVAFNYPALFLLVMMETDPSERGFAVASFGFFFDAAGALGPPMLGLLIAGFDNERAAFAAGAVTSAAGLIGLLRLTSGDRYTAAAA